MGIVISDVPPVRDLGPVNVCLVPTSLPTTPIRNLVRIAHCDSTKLTHYATRAPTTAKHAP